MIPQETIDKIFESARIEEIIGDFVELKKAGVNYKGRCPFHDEKTPSFVVSPTKGIYKCFGCGKGGNSIKFIQDMQGANYPEALRYVAGKYNIEIIEKELTEEQKNKISAKESQLIATKFASQYFQDMLWNTEEGRTVGLSYFKERGFSDKIIKLFHLGYSPRKKNAFEKYAIKAGHDKTILFESSLIGESEAGKSYDKFRERTIFPINSYSGKVIGFGGRAFSPGAKSKYLNSSETLIYDKSKVLYGLDISKQSISKANRCFVVEGYTDVIAMYQNGIENVVSASGTALGVYQIGLIKRSTHNIILLFDGDDAGKKATIRSIDLCLKLEMNVKIASFPPGEDPDSYSRKLTTNEFQSYLDENAVNFVDYLIKIYKLHEEKDPAKIIEIKKHIISSIAEIPDVFSREEYCKIYHDKLGVSEQALLQQISKVRSVIKSGAKNILLDKTSAIKGVKKSKNTAEKKLQKQEEEVLRLLINYGNEYFSDEEGGVAEMIITELRQDKIKFSNTQLQKLYLEIIALIETCGSIDIQKLTNNTDHEISKQTVDLIAQAHNISDNWKQKHNIITSREDDKLYKTTEKAILSLKKGIVDLEISKLQEQLKSDSISEEGMIKLSKLTKLKTQIAKILGRNIG